MSVKDLPRRQQPTASLASGRQKLLGHLAGFSFAMLIAGSFSIGSLASPHIGPAAINALRFMLAFGALIAINAVLMGRMPRLPQAPWRFAIIGALMATYFLTMFIALGITSPVSTGAVFTLIPLMSAAFGWMLLRQTTRPIVILSLLIAACGAIWVIFGADLEALLGFRIGRGEAIFMVGCAGHAAVAPLTKKFHRGEPGIYFTLCTVSGTGLWLVVAAAPDLAAIEWASLPPIVWFAVFYLATFATIATFFLLQFASVRLPASKVLSYGYLTPSAIIIIEGLIGHGWASWPVLAGALVTALALLVMAFGPDA